MTMLRAKKKRSYRISSCTNAITKMLKHKDAQYLRLFLEAKTLRFYILILLWSYILGQ